MAILPVANSQPGPLVREVAQRHRLASRVPVAMTTKGCIATCRWKITGCRMVTTMTVRRKTPGAGSHPTSFGPCPVRVTLGVMLERHGTKMYPLIIPHLGQWGSRRSRHSHAIFISADLPYRRTEQVGTLITISGITPTIGLWSRGCNEKCSPSDSSPQTRFRCLLRCRISLLRPTLKHRGSGPRSGVWKISMKNQRGDVKRPNTLLINNNGCAKSRRPRCRTDGDIDKDPFVLYCSFFSSANPLHFVSSLDTVFCIL